MVQVTIYYDGECPFCTRYVQYLRLKTAVGPLRLIDLRQDRNARQAFQEQGYAPDKGMIADIGGRIYHGADAMHALSLIAGPAGMVNRLMAGLFSSPIAASIGYPVLRAGRAVVLEVLGRRPLADEDAGVEAKFRLFALMFGLFSIFHAAAYAFFYSRFPPSLDILAVFIFGAGVFLRPDSRRLFLGLMIVSLVSGWIQAPASSNHTLLRNYVALSFVAVYGVHLLRGAGWQRIFADFSIVAGAGLVVMYFFGVFHKINGDFLDPATSCAVVLWRLMPSPLSYFDGPIVQYGAIYATFVVEGVILVALFVRPLRHLAIAAGILFHWLLALSDFSFYLAFTTLSISLHLLFLSPDAALQVMRSPVMVAFTSRLRSPLWIAIGVLYLAIIAVLIIQDRYSDVTLMASIFVFPVCYAVLRYGASGRHSISSPDQVAGASGRVIASAFAAMFFAACMLPYTGLKSAQAMNMFANLRIEGGVSNHLIFRNPPTLFDNLSHVVTVREVKGEPRLNWIAKENQGLVYYDLLSKLRANPNARVTFEKDGALFADQDARSLSAEISATLYPPLSDKVMNFRPVPLGSQSPCT